MTRLAPILTLVAALAVASAQIAFGQTYAESPSVTLMENTVVRNIQDDGDRFVLVRYELPISGSIGITDAWCSYLQDTTGCDSDPADPSEPTSLPRDLAFLTYYSNGRSDPGSLEAQVPLARIGHGLAGAYFGAGNSLFWGDGDAEVCIESSSLEFSTNKAACQSPSFAGSDSTTSAQRDQLGSALITFLRNMQTTQQLAQGEYVIDVNEKSDALDGQVTPSGRVFALEALGNMDRIVPEAFQAGAGRTIQDGYTPVAGDSALQQQLDAEADASGLTDNLNNAAEHFLGTSGAVLGIAFTLTAGMIFAGIAMWRTESTVMATVAFMTPTAVGIWMRAPTVAVLFVVAGLLAMFAGWWLVNRNPG